MLKYTKEVVGVAFRGDNVFNLQFHRNCKNNFFKGKLESGKLSQLFIESGEHAQN